MPESGELAVTRVALLELRDERRLVQEGYDLLDEKRMLLAGEILRQLHAHAAARQAAETAATACHAALAAAVGVHGFDDISVEPPCPLQEIPLHVEVRSFLGIHLATARLDGDRCRPVRESMRDTPELRACAASFRRWVQALVTESALAANLRRLVIEYRRTERRARALENVLLPEIDQSLHFIEDQLDAVDQDEAVRVRNAARAR